MLSKIARRRAASPPLTLPSPAARLGSLPPVPEASSETHRIAALPRVDYAGADMNGELGLDGGEVRLWPVQSEALAATRQAGGLFAPIAVGNGKTLIALLAGTVLDADLALVFTKARIVAQMRRMFDEARSSFRLVPTRILSYAMLSRASGTDLLDDIAAAYAPEKLVIVADEAHCLANPKSARTGRILRFFRENPDVRFVALSGTLLSKSVRDCAHLAELALRERSPFPRSRSHIDAWSETLDVDGRPGPEHWERMSSFGAFGFSPALRGAARTESLRKAFSTRLRSAPGVVMSGENEVGASLELVPIELDVPAIVEDALAELRRSNETPDGEVCADDVSQWRAARELSAGFFYQWQWPDVFVRNGAGAGVNTGPQPDTEWLEARSRWNRNVRAELERSAARGYDSPLLVSQAVERELVSFAARSEDKPPALVRAWLAWRTEKEKPAPPTVPVWLSSFLVDDAVALATKLAHKGEPPIIWYESKAIEAALVARGGFPVYDATVEPPEGPARLCAASWRAHGTGRNLQAWRTAIVVEPPSSGKAWEQLLGRLHRRGQTADEVVFYVYQHTASFRRALASAETAERFVADSTGEKRRLLYATRAEVLRR